MTPVLRIFAAAGVAAAASIITTAAPDKEALPDLSSFTFTRGMYESDDSTGEAFYGYDGRVWARWETDYPECDENFSARLGHLTRINVNRKAESRSFSARDLGDHPLLYISDPGWMMLSQPEKDGLAEYLANGGFVWTDDFWGEAEWKNFADVMTDVLHGLTWREITPEHPIFHSVYDLHEMPQIPALPFARGSGGDTAEPPQMHKYPAGRTWPAHMRGWFDSTGRLMIVATYNTDLGDGFEREAYGQWYFERFSTRAYMLGVNIVTYAMTH